MRGDVLAALNDARAARRAAILITDIADGAQRLVREDAIAADPLAEVLAKHLASGKSGLVEAGGRTLFLTVQVPPVRLVVVGAVHISQAMAPMAAGLDLALTVIDPRTAFATPERFPGAALVAEWPDAALGTAVPVLDRYCALAALTHDPKIDDPALKAARAGYAISVSGIAGPDGGSESKPVGTVWFAIASSAGEGITRCERFDGDRESVRRQATAYALRTLSQQFL